MTTKEGKLPDESECECKPNPIHDSNQESNSPSEKPLFSAVEWVEKMLPLWDDDELSDAYSRTKESYLAVSQIYRRLSQERVHRQLLGESQKQKQKLEPPNPNQTE